MENEKKQLEWAKEIKHLLISKIGNYRSGNPAQPSYSGIPFMSISETAKEITELIESKLKEEARIAPIEKITERLAKLYSDEPSFIANICDEVLDRSGKLLGEVREMNLKQ